MIGMIALTFALPDESRTFVAGLTNPVLLGRDDGLLPVVTGLCHGERVIVIHTGVGEAPAYRARLARLLTDGGDAGGKPILLVSGGYAGGLQSGITVGDLILGKNVSDPGWLAKAREMLVSWKPLTGRLITRSATAETTGAKRALGVATGAIAVDMETAWVAAVCAEAGVPMLSLRVISDAVNQSFPVPGNILFDARRQRPRYIAMPLWLLFHPARIVPFIRFVRGLTPARTRLAGAMRTLVRKVGTRNAEGGKPK